MVAKFFVKLTAEKIIAILAMKVHSRALLTELITIIIGTVSKKSSKKVYIRKRFSSVISLYLISGRLKRIVKR